MGINEMLVINNGMPNTIIGAIVIFVILLVIYTIGYSKLMEYKEEKLMELKSVAQDGINNSKHKKQK